MSKIITKKVLESEKEVSRMFLKIYKKALKFPFKQKGQTEELENAIKKEKLYLQKLNQLEKYL